MQRARERAAGRGKFSLSRELMALRFAQLYVQNDFSWQRAYQALRGDKARARSKRCVREWAQRWIAQPRVLAHIRDLVQDGTQTAQEIARVGIDQLLSINEMVILNDVTNYLEEVVHRDFDEATQRVTERRELRYKPLSALSIGQRMAIKSIQVGADGQITKIVPYDATKAKVLHVALLEVLERRGGPDQSWHAQFKQRMTAAREQRIQREIARGKVIMLPTASAAPSDEEGEI